MKKAIIFHAVIGGVLMSISLAGMTKDAQPGEDPNLKHTSKKSKTEAVSGVTVPTGSPGFKTGEVFQEDLKKHEPEKKQKEQNR